MSGDYQLNKAVFQRIQKIFQKESINKDIRLSNSSVGSRQHRKHLKTRLVKNKRTCSPSSADPSSTESIKEISRRRKDSYLDSSFLDGPSMDRLIKKPDYFHFTTGQIRKRIDLRQGDDKK
jgi:hypothetical protein